MDGWVGGWMNEFMDGWVAGWMGWWLDGLYAASNKDSNNHH